MEEAVQSLKRSRDQQGGAEGTASTQPLLFFCQDQYYVKIDNDAIAIHDASCFIDCIDFLFCCFWVFSVSYPLELRLFYGFIEKCLGIKPTVGKSSILGDLFRKISASS